MRTPPLLFSLLALCACGTTMGTPTGALDGSVECVTPRGELVKPGTFCQCTSQNTGVWACQSNGPSTLVAVCVDCRFTCVGEGTLVDTPSGARRIERLEVDDVVIAVDPTTGQREAARVQAIRSSVREVFSFQGGALLVTDDHPLFDPTSGTFHPASDWLTGRRSTLMATSSSWAGVQTVTEHPPAGLHQVFDLVVDHRWHTFVAGGIVVHNKSGGCYTENGLPVTQDDPCSCGDGGLSGYRSCERTNYLGPVFSTCTRCGLLVDGGLPPDGG
jgi:hypothetical protein